MKIKYLTIDDYDKCSPIFGESEYLEKILSSKGYKIGFFSDDFEPICIILIVYGSKPKHAYIAEVWTNGTLFSNKLLAAGRRMFDTLHKNWHVVFHTKNVSKFKNHCVKHTDTLYKYTGCIK